VSSAPDTPLDLTLEGIIDPIPILHWQVFAHEFRHGQINASQKQVRSQTVEDALRSVGQTFASMGTKDPRLLVPGRQDFGLQQKFAAYAKNDPPPNRVKLVPIPIL
jgi:hypothetical protein